jgi:hypothetical protein
MVYDNDGIIQLGQQLAAQVPPDYDEQQRALLARVFQRFNDMVVVIRREESDEEG